MNLFFNEQYFNLCQKFFSALLNNMMDNSVEMFGETHFDTWFMVLII